MTIPTIVSFYTPNWEYPAHAHRLRAECERLGLPHIIEERPDLGGWLANCRQKPVFLGEVMDRLRSPVFWLDVDCSLLRTPAGLKGDVDFMAARRPEGHIWGWEWFVYAMLFNPTPGGFRLLRHWVVELGTEPGGDDSAFNRLWMREGGSFLAAPLPAGYGDSDDAHTVRLGVSDSSAKRSEVRRLCRLRGLI